MRALPKSGRENMATCIAMIVLTGLFLIARFAVRLSQRQAPFGADWLCLLSALPFYAYCALIVNCRSFLGMIERDALKDIS